MNILILGSGGREHTLAWKINQSDNCTKLYVAPGNAGTASCAENVDLALTDFDAIKAFIIKNDIQKVVVGPEAPLVNGIYDYLMEDGRLQNLQVIGPSKKGAMLEGSKAYAKEFMKEMNIPTAAYEEFTQDNVEKGIAYIHASKPPYVLKADGLAAGKGVLIIQDKEEAATELKKMLEGKFGDASRKVVIEEFLDGIEFSVFVLTDGSDYVILPVAKDYKRIGEGDTGLNTGGMGAVSPPPFVDDSLMEKVEERIIKPTIEGLKKRSISYEGFIFFGLIRVNYDPYVIEYNCRMGDPETEVVIPRLENDLVTIFDAMQAGELGKLKINTSDQSAATVMLVSGGYPESYEKSKIISGLDETTGSIIFHAGTKIENDKVLTNGGRVIAITSFGKDHVEAVTNSKKNAVKIDFEGKYFRRDIGFDL